ncbi:MAG: hypothetical protein FWE31_01205 [Firmicutes bacterium]|nr:hypothetical protein [Bacillota bacterium]
MSKLRKVVIGSTLAMALGMGVLGYTSDETYVTNLSQVSAEEIERLELTRRERSASAGGTVGREVRYIDQDGNALRRELSYEERFGNAVRAALVGGVTTGAAAWAIGGALSVKEDERS